MPNLVEYAQYELDRLQKAADKSNDEDGPSCGMQCQMNEGIMDIVKIFAEQGHSGFSAGYAINLLDRLLNFRPVTPLTGEDDEWGMADNSSDPTIQNKRCFSVFKNLRTGVAHDIDRYIYSDNGGVTWFYGGSVRHLRDETITFPYMPPSQPERVYVKRDPNNDDICIEVTDKEEITRMAKEYREEREQNKRESLEAVNTFLNDGSEPAVE